MSAIINQMPGVPMPGVQQRPHPPNEIRCSGVYKIGARKGNRCENKKTRSSQFCSNHNPKKIKKREEQKEREQPEQPEYCQLCRNNIDKHLSKIRLGCQHSFHYKCFIIMCEDQNGFIFNSNKCLTCNYDAKDELNRECSICLDHMMNDIVKTKCNHYFHDTCLNEWNKLNGCPLCRSDLI